MVSRRRYEGDRADIAQLPALTEPLLDKVLVPARPANGRSNDIGFRRLLNDAATQHDHLVGPPAERSGAPHQSPSRTKWSVRRRFPSGTKRGRRQRDLRSHSRTASRSADGLAAPVAWGLVPSNGTSGWTGTRIGFGRLPNDAANDDLTGRNVVERPGRRFLRPERSVGRR